MPQLPPGAPGGGGCPGAPPKGVDAARFAQVHQRAQAAGSTEDPAVMDMLDEVAKSLSLEVAAETETQQPAAAAAATAAAAEDIAMA